MYDVQYYRDGVLLYWRNSQNKKRLSGLTIDLHGDVFRYP